MKKLQAMLVLKLCRPTDLMVEMKLKVMFMVVVVVNMMRMMMITGFVWRSGEKELPGRGWQA